MEEEEIVEERVHDVKLKEELSKRYLSYAMSTIVARSLPDVRDGLKPVHRRIIYAAYENGYDYNKPFKKSARIVGEVMGKYHPHGDSSVYEAMVRMAQPFSMRLPLIDGQGNFGSMDGDSAAAMRYTEARLAKVAHALIEDIECDTVDFMPNYDESLQEPTVLPARFPNLLVNGTNGIAVGMATNIPPHNLGEIVSACCAYIDNPDITVEELINYVPGPDFPTGGLIIADQKAIIDAYTFGKGYFRIRAKWEKEDLGKGQYQIVVTEIPYQVIKSKLIEKIAQLLEDKKLPLLADVRDESAHDVRIVLEPKNRSVDANLLMEHLFKQTELEIRFAMNMNVLSSDCVPRVMSLKEVLKEYLNHRHKVLIRKSQYRLDKIMARLEILSGYLVAYLNLDEVIRIIREEEDAKAALMAKFGLTDNQAEAILNMKLRNLRKLEEEEIRGEFDELTEEKNGLEQLLGSEELRFARLAEEIDQMKEKFGKKTPLGRRRSQFADMPEDVDVPIEAMVEKEPITVILSQKGWIRSMKGYVPLTDEFKFKEDDALQFAIHAYTTDKIILFDTSGKFFNINANEIPSGRGFGQPVRLMADLGVNDNVCAMFAFEKGAKYVVSSDCGHGFVIDESHILAQTRNGRKIMNLADGEVAAFCKKLPATWSLWSVKTASCSFLSWRKSRRWRAAAGSGCKNTRLAGS